MLNRTMNKNFKPFVAKVKYFFENIVWYFMLDIKKIKVIHS